MLDRRPALTHLRASGVLGPLQRRVLYRVNLRITTWTDLTLGNPRCEIVGAALRRRHLADLLRARARRLVGEAKGLASRPAGRRPSSTGTPSRVVPSRKGSRANCRGSPMRHPHNSPLPVMPSPFPGHPTIPLAQRGLAVRPPRIWVPVSFSVSLFTIQPVTAGRFPFQDVLRKPTYVLVPQRTRNYQWFARKLGHSRGRDDAVLSQDRIIAPNK